LDLKKTEVADCTQEIEETIRQINAALTATFKSFVKDGKTVEYYQAFTEQQVAVIVNALGAAINKLGGIVYQDGPGENTPIPFDGASFADHLEVLADQENVSQFIDTLIIRIRTMLADPQMKTIVGGAQDLTLAEWLDDYICDSNPTGSATVIDLSLIPSEIIHIVTAVIARMIFEALQRYRINHPDGKTLTVFRMCPAPLIEFALHAEEPGFINLIIQVHGWFLRLHNSVGSLPCLRHAHGFPVFGLLRRLRPLDSPSPVSVASPAPLPGG
jgi:hypothetical protein